MKQKTRTISGFFVYISMTCGMKQKLNCNIVLSKASWNYNPKKSTFMHCCFKHICQLRNKDICQRYFTPRQLIMIWLS